MAIVASRARCVHVHMCLYEVKQVDCCPRMRYHKQLYYAGGYGGYALSISAKLLLRRDGPMSAKVLELCSILEGVL